MKEISLRPDAKGRITLGKLAEGVSSFKVSAENGKIVLEPYAEIPINEKWLFENKKVMNSLKRGLEEEKGEMDLTDFLLSAPKIDIGEIERPVSKPRKTGLE